METRPNVRSMIRDAMEILWTLRPRDVTEALLAVQIVLLGYHAMQATIVAAAHDGELEKMLLWGKHGMALQRRAAALERRLDAHRLAVEARGEVVEAPPGWTYEHAALEAAWRKQPVLVRPETEEEAAAAALEVEWPEGEVMEMPAGMEAVVAGEVGAPLASELPLSRAERRRLEKMQRKLAVRLASRLAAETRRAEVAA